MSARAPVGISNRASLFDSARNQPTEEPIQENTTNMHEIMGTPRPEDDPLQLEHMIGYAGLFKGTLLAVPNRENTFIKR